ncbi:hypothetical protein L6272_04155 [Microgenomates group bacterium]|nr:hypothetical protein [Microgenomates group bacterium]
MILQAQPIFGNIQAPGTSGTSGRYTKYGVLTDPGLGLAKFISNLLIFIITIAGLFTLVNFIIAGYLYMSSNGEPQKLMAAGNKMLQSLIGLAVISGAFIIAGIIGHVFFRDATFLFHPIFRGVEL